MKNIFLIASKELRSYFASPIAYILMAAFALIFGITFYSSVRYMMQMGMQSQMMGQSQPMSVNDMVIGPLLGFAGTITLFLVPMITMRLIAEEKRTGTIELLLTSPVKDSALILGKWLGAMLLYLCILGMSVLCIALVFIWGKPDLQPVLVAYLGLILQGGALLALGLWISSMTRNQIVAGGVTFFVSLFLYLLKYNFEFDSGPVAQVASYVCIVTHLENFSKGLLSLKDVVFYLSMIFLCLFLTSRSMESLRWRA
jgi:ABC-2 type transport system permease protein